MVFSLIRVVTKEWSNDIEKVLTPLESLTLFLGSFKHWVSCIEHSRFDSIYYSTKRTWLRKNFDFCWAWSTNSETKRPYDCLQCYVYYVIFADIPQKCTKVYWYIAYKGKPNPPPPPQGIIPTNLWFRYRVRLSCPPNARMVPVMAAGKRFITNK